MDKNAWSNTSTPPIRLHGVVLSYAQGQLAWTHISEGFTFVILIQTTQFCKLSCKFIIRTICIHKPQIYLVFCMGVKVSLTLK